VTRGTSSSTTRRWSMSPRLIANTWLICFIAESAPISAEAERASNDSWRVRMLAASSGKWPLSLAIVLGQNDHIEMTAPILIE
jgi:hypothetical protein